MEGNEFYLRPPEEMYRNFQGLESAVARSQEIADSVDLQLTLGERYFPVFDLPVDRTPEDELRDLCLKGLHDRYKNNLEMRSAEGELSEAVMDRLNRELGVINKLGFADYFLICWDLSLIHI